MIRYIPLIIYKDDRGDRDETANEIRVVFSFKVPEQDVFDFSVHFKRFKYMYYPALYNKAKVLKP